MARKKKSDTDGQADASAQAGAEAARDIVEADRERGLIESAEKDGDQAEEKIGPTLALYKALSALGADASNDSLKEWCRDNLGRAVDSWGTGFYIAKKAALKKLGVVSEDKPSPADPRNVGRTAALPSASRSGATLRDLLSSLKAVEELMNEFGADAILETLRLADTHGVETVREIIGYLIDRKGG